MKIPAVRAKIGIWTYYISTLTFEQVSQYVEKIDDQLHSAQLLRELIQRSITSNYLSIKEYILNQPEMFFNSLVLGVYDGMPQWIEVELNFGNEEFYNLGFLEFPGNQKIFPVDGQHRVEGIKAALERNPELKDHQIGAIFIGHSKEEEGMKRSRRLFTTLNRYAKPVTMDDLIALDEDDSIAIVTRNLLESYDFFNGSRITKNQSKAILDGDKSSFTSLITLYQCNRELLKLFRTIRKREDPNPDRDKKSFENYLKFRPDENEIELFQEFLMEFWDSFIDNLDDIQDFYYSEESEPARPYRNRIKGGSLLFRPVGLLPLVQSVIEINKRIDMSFDKILTKFNNIDFTISEKPWKNVLWSPTEKTMIMGTQVLVKLLLLYIFDPEIIRPAELLKLKERYADKLSWVGEIDEILNDVPIL